MPLQKEAESYTYADYLTWDENERIEIIDGMPVMQATPTRIHQKISMQLSIILGDYLKGKPCEVYAAPFTVRLDAKDDDSDITVLEPDIVVVCDKSKLDNKGCKGAPDLVIEILSPSTARTDRLVKYQLYERAGVREYWIVDPDAKIVEILLLQNGIFSVKSVYSDTETVNVHVLNGCTVNLQEVFED